MSYGGSFVQTYLIFLNVLVYLLLVFLFMKSYGTDFCHYYFSGLFWKHMHSSIYPGCLLNYIVVAVCLVRLGFLLSVPLVY